MTKHSKKPHEAKEELDNFERELFLDAFYQGDIVLQAKYQDVIARRATGVMAPIGPRGTPEHEDGEQDRALFLQAVNEGFAENVAIHKARHEKPQRVPRPKKKSLVDAEIDLHGYSVENAIFALNHFIDRQQQRGSRTLLIVHGKGTGILKNAVWSAVDLHPLVDDFQIASGKLGGQGAIVVRINRKAARRA